MLESSEVNSKVCLAFKQAFPSKDCSDALFLSPNTDLIHILYEMYIYIYRDTEDKVC